MPQTPPPPRLSLAAIASVILNRDVLMQSGLHLQRSLMLQTLLTFRPSKVNFSFSPKTLISFEGKGRGHIQPSSWSSKDVVAASSVNISDCKFYTADCNTPIASAPEKITFNQDLQAANPFSLANPFTFLEPQNLRHLFSTSAFPFNSKEPGGY